MDNDWIENTGTVPAGVGPDTRLEVAYRDGARLALVDRGIIAHNDPEIWTIEGVFGDITSFRFLETPAERDARILRGIGDLLDAGRIAEQTGRDGE